jgi:hypothetical protein
MTVDPSEVGKVAATLMDNIDMDDLPPGAEVVEVLVLAGIVFPVPDEPEASGSTIAYRCTSALPWVQKGLAEHLADAIKRNARRLDEDF